ncbi:MAG: dihydroorotate dehydrogenase-like protein [Spirochaetales bacterium]|nr:dihydroorotate dehydrogenase-like protein [Spirochaetales bacterium]
MADCGVSYLGLKLKNPLIVASSRLTSDIEKVVACQKAGAGALVLKSLFEEQIMHDSGAMTKGMDFDAHSDAADFFRATSHNYYMDQYLKFIEDCKKEIDIPVIASLNCISDGKWMSYAGDLQKSGADALELNVFILPSDVKQTSEHLEKVYVNIAEKIKKKVSIPVSMKIGCHFTGMANVMARLAAVKMDGLVLFNRFYKPDIDIEKLKLIPAMIFSAEEEMALSLQWIALMSGELDCDLAATTGVHSSNGVIKQLLAGAKAVQLCSVLYKNGLEYMGKIITELQTWMEKHNFSDIPSFCGKLAQEASDNPAAYERAQYIKALVGIS